MVPPPIRVLPNIAQDVPLRAAQLNLPASMYVAILIWNQVQAPVPLVVEPDSAQVSRVNLGISWRRGLRPLVAKIARAAGLSANAAVEALIARDLRAAESALTILPARGSKKPRH